MNPKIVSALKWVFIEQSSSQIISFAVLLILARILGPESFGLLALSYFFTSFIVDLVQQSFVQAIVHREDIEPDHYQAAFWANVGLSAVTLVLILLFADHIAALLGEPDIAPILRALAIILLITPVLVVQQAIFKRELNFKPLATQLLIATLVGNVVAVVMALLGYGVWSLVGRELVTQALNAALLMKVSSWRPKLQFSKRHFTDLVSYGSHAIYGNLATFLSIRSDVLLIGYFLGATSLGYYNIALRLVSTLNNVLGRAVEKVAMPSFARLQNKPEELKQGFLNALSGTSVVVFPICIGLAICIPQLSPILFSPKWDPSIPIMQVLLVLGIAQNLTFVNAALVMGVGQPEQRTYLVAIEAALKIICIVLTFQQGLVAVAVGVTLASYIVIPLWIRAISKAANIAPAAYLRSILPPFFAAILMYLSVTLLLDSSLIKNTNVVWVLASKTILGFLVYALACLIYYRKRIIDFVSARKPST